MKLRHASETDRVRRYSTDEQLRRIDEKTERNVRLYSSQSPEVIDERIRELRCEWSIERYLQINVAAVGLSTALLAATRNRKWGLATCAGLALFFVHAREGFDPPLPLLRQMGIRTRAEIHRELFALKALRGDFGEVDELEEQSESPSVRAALDAVGL